jgi:hypothetical protein
MEFDVDLDLPGDAGVCRVMLFSSCKGLHELGLDPRERGLVSGIIAFACS